MQSADQTLRRKPLKDEVFDVLHQDILSGKYAAGAWLRQEEIARRLGVSMTPVREALDLLVAAGLAERVAYRGVRILQPSVLKFWTRTRSGSSWRGSPPGQRPPISRRITWPASCRSWMKETDFRASMTFRGSVRSAGRCIRPSSTPVATPCSHASTRRCFGHSRIGCSTSISTDARSCWRKACATSTRSTV